MKNKNIAVIAAAIAIVGGAAWYLNAAGEGAAGGAGAGAGGKGAGRAGDAPTVVNAVSAQRQDVPVVLTANGTVTPISSVDLHPQTTSTIRKVHIKEGQFVKAGQLMFTLDDRSEQANVSKARAQVARDQAALADAERQLKRSQELADQKFIALSALDTLRSQRDAARALLEANRAALSAENVNASFGAIRAPMAGRVGAINVFPGSLVQLTTSLTTITQLDPITVSFTLPEAALANLLAAQKRGPVTVQASTAGAATGGAATPAAAVQGKLSFIDNAVDATTGAIRVKAQFDNKDTSLWPGQYVNTRITVQTISDAVVVPQTAIITSTRGTFVYVVDADKSARQMPVERLHSFGLLAAVSGLTGSEKVITEGKQNLRPGGKVRLADAPGKPGEKAGGNPAGGSPAGVKPAGAPDATPAPTAVAAK